MTADDSTLEPRSRPAGASHPQPSPSTPSLALPEAPSTQLCPANAPPPSLGNSRRRYSALKHGLFSAVVLDDESGPDYASLLRGLIRSFQPQGVAETVLVEKLAALLWRHRRLLVAECAEIRSAAQFVDWDLEDQQRQHAQALDFSSLEFHGGLMAEIQNPLILRRCLDLLAELRQGLEESGFDPDRDYDILKKIYGDEDHWVCAGLPNAYASWQLAVEHSEEEADSEDFEDESENQDDEEEPDTEDPHEEPPEEPYSEGHPSPDACVRNFLQALRHEVRRLRQYQKSQAAIARARTPLQVLRLHVPAWPALDRLLKYEASLERAFDRTLSQLERLQRMRAGQPVPPPLKLEVS